MKFETPDPSAHSQRIDARAFIEGAAFAILRRQPDERWVQHSLAQIARGRSREDIVAELLLSDEGRAHLGIKLFVPPGHHYSPVCDPLTIKPRQACTPPREISGIHIDHDEMVDTWRQILPFLRSNPFAGEREGRTRYRFDNPAYSWGDGLILHAMIRHSRPRRIVEVGSGWSSACIVDTVEQCLDRECAITLIDIDLQLARELIGSYSGRIEYCGLAVQQMDPAIFRNLEANDILLIDSSHVLKTGSDVNFLLFDVLPFIRPGVLVHFHDMFWPFEYPDEWIIGENRSWNEIYAMHAFLTDNTGWKIKWFNDYFRIFERGTIEDDYAMMLNNPGGALWLEKL